MDQEFPHQNEVGPVRHMPKQQLINPHNLSSDEIKAESYPSQDNC